MTVSVVVPVRDGARYLGEALESVAAQTLAAGEVIVVDDGSTDDSAAIAAAHGARVVRQPPLGPSAARNRGIEATGGDLVALLDADDRWLPDKLERQTATLRERDDVDVLFGHVRQFRAPELGGGMEEPRPGVLFSTLIVRRRAFARAGLFDETWRAGELMDWLARARDAGLRDHVADDVVALRRVHATNLSRDPEARRDYARVLKRAIDRRRGA
ncbi:MAG TPA: glycosyltransferase family A protein [Solirubrobacteraceae bacterium]